MPLLFKWAFVPEEWFAKKSRNFSTYGVMKHGDYMVPFVIFLGELGWMWLEGIGFLS